MMKQYRTILLILGITAFIPSFDSNMVGISLPEISDTFRISAPDVSWVVLAYMLALSSSMILMGKIGDIIGVKKLLLAGHVLFLTFSILSAFSWNIYAIAVFRFFQGLGGAALMIGSFSMAAKSLPGEKSSSGYAALITVSAVAISLGGPVGGIITYHFSWRYVFMITAPFILANIFLIYKFIPDENNAKKTPIKDFDFTGALLGFLTLGGFMLYLSWGDDTELFSPQDVFVVPATVIFLILLILRERKHPEPIYKISPYKKTGVFMLLIPVFLTATFQGGTNYLLPFYMQTVKSFTSEKAGFVLLAYSLSIIVSSRAADKFSGKFNRNLLIYIGLTLIAIGSSIMLYGLGKPGTYYVVAFLTLYGAGFGLLNPNIIALVMSKIPSDHKGHFSGIYQTFIRTTIATGIVIYGVIYSRGLPENIINVTDMHRMKAEFTGELIRQYERIFTAGLFSIIAAGISFALFKVLSEKKST